MRTPDEPTCREDATSLSAIGLGAGLAVLATGLAIAVAVARPAADRGVEPPPLRPAVSEVAEVLSIPDAGADRLVGRVLTEDGRSLDGYLRWDGGAASWGDLLPATRAGSRVLEGVRFGHLARLERTGPTGIRAVSRSGRVAHLQAGGTVGRAGRVATEPVVSVETDDGVERVAWRDVRVLLFEAGVRRSAPVSERLHGTVATASGDTFTGYVLWNGTEGLLSDDVGDELASGAAPVSFADALVVRRTGPGTLAIETRHGQVTRIASRDLIRPGLDEVVVADPGLGVVAVPWSAFRTLTVHPAERPLGPDDFDGGVDLHGTVTTVGGEVLSGPVAWDLEEGTTAALLDGQDRQVRYAVEFGRAATVEKHRQGVRVTLRDGRSLYLAGTNDVNWANRGVRVGERTIPWTDFRVLRLDEPGAR